MKSNKSSQRSQGSRPANMKNKSRQNTSSRGSSEKSFARVVPANVGRVVIAEIPKPIQTPMKNGNLLVKHTEFISKIYGSQKFKYLQQPINPGLPAQFQWMFPVANRYEKYRIKKMTYRFVNSKAGTFSGDIIMGIDYDASDPSPFSEFELQAYWGCKTGQICSPLNLHADLKALHRNGPLFTRVGDLPPNSDIKLYDAGNFFIATSDCDNDNDPVGRLFVDYEIELMTPASGNSAILSSSNVSVGPTQANLLGTDFISEGPLKLRRVNVGGFQSFQVPVPGEYMFTVTVNGTGLTGTTAMSKNNIDDVVVKMDEVVSGTIAVSLWRIVIQDVNDSFIPSIGGSTTITGCRVRLAQYTNRLN